MIPKSGYGFRKRSCSTNKLKRDADSKKSHPALDPFSAHIPVEPLNGARPCLRGRGLVVAFRRRVIEEPMNRIRIDMAFVPDVVFLELGFLRRIGLRQVLVEGAVVDEDGRLDF